jgi:4-amino-4-deoxy-L-arabinose transferase-like glycosyltransferase
VVVALALVLRLAYLDATPGHVLRYDELDYDGHAVSIAAGRGFSDTLAHGRPTAFRPPGYPYLLAGVYRVAGDDRAGVAERVRVARMAQAVIGTLAVALIGLLASQLWGRWAGLTAMVLGAVYVPLITVGGSVMSEPLFVVIALAALCATVQYRRSAHRWRWLVLAGVLGGLAVLTRANGMVLLPALVLAVWGGPDGGRDRERGRFMRTALVPPASLVVVVLVVVAPWTIRNAVVLHSFVPVSTQLGSALAGTYNDQARGERAAWRSIRHVPAFAELWRRVATTPEPEVERKLRAASLDYIRRHPAYVVEVGFWNTVRLLDLAGLKRSRATAATIGIDNRWAVAGVVCFWLFAAVALGGALTARARRTPLFVWTVPALLSLSVVFLVVETPRYRTAVDPFVVLLAALPVSSAGRRFAFLWRSRRHPDIRSYRLSSTPTPSSESTPSGARVTSTTLGGRRTSR